VQSFSISDRGRARLHRSRRDSRLQSPGEFLDIEARLTNCGMDRIAGVDEAGRGPLAGPVVASAVVLRQDDIPDGIRDSKKLTANQRECLYWEITLRALSVGIGIVSAQAIDRINILQATRWAMLEAVQSLKSGCDCAIVDGNVLPDTEMPAIGIVKGDSRCVSVAAASIVAKVTRDRLMDHMHTLYPRYSFRCNKGYGTRAHMEALRRYGPTRIHRLSFGPVLSAFEGWM
jgi:ribonuclease HII